ncbi:MAG: nucleoside/nucleotide kinase family protein [Microbacterium sp.]
MTESIEQLVARARQLADAPGRRILGIAGAPGAGKSTLSAALREALGDQAVLVGMDGFHLADEELVRLGRRERKGAPDTFDVGGYVSLLDRLRSQSDGVVYAPRFARELETSIGGAVAVHARTPLVITEGNYLLRDRDGWQDVAARLDECWYLDLATEVRAARLVRRRVSHGEDEAAATAWVYGVDEVNTDAVLRTRDRANLIVTLTG